MTYVVLNFDSTAELLACVCLPLGRSNRLKDIVVRNALLRRLVLRTGQGGYESAQRMDDEWHLRAFDANMLNSVVQGPFTVDQLSAVPSPVLPLRLVAKLRPL